MPTLDYRSSKKSPSPEARGPQFGAPSVALSVAALSVIGALAYAGSAVSLVGYRLLTGGFLTLLWVGAGAGLGALLLRVVLGRALRQPCSDDGSPAPAAPSRPSRASGGPLAAAPPEINPLLHAVTSAALGLGLIGLAALGLGLAGWLHFATALLLLAIGLSCGALFLLVRARDRRGADGVPAEATPRGKSSRWDWLWLAAAPFLAVSLVGTTVPPGLLWSPEEPHGYDVAEYHLQVPREWYEAGRIVPLRHNVFCYFPMGAEVHYLLAMHLQGGPWEGMYLAQLMHLALVVLAALAVCGVAIQVAPDRRSATLAAVAAATVPWLAQLGAVAYTEGGFLLFGTLAVGWAIRATGEASPPARRLRHFAVGGAMAGLACGTKLTAVPEILLGVPAACAAAYTLRVGPAPVTRSRAAGSVNPPGIAALPHLRPILGGCIAFVLVGLLLFAPWLARDAAWTGNPVFPEAAKVLGKAHWNDVQVERWHRANHEPGADHRGPAGRLRASWEQVLGSWQFGYLFLPLSLFAFASCAAAGWRPPAVLVPGILLASLAVFWIGFTHLQGRFFLLAVPLGTMLIAQVDWGGRLRWVAALVAAAAGVGWLGLNSRIVTAVHGGPGKPGGLADALGRTPLNWITPSALEAFPAGAEALQTHPEARIALIGEARAFYYQVPMSRLRYRTVFDLDAAALPASPGEHALVNAWEGQPPGAARPAGEWLVISGPELQRLSKTYFAVPAPPPTWVRGEESMVVRAGEAIPR